MNTRSTTEPSLLAVKVHNVVYDEAIELINDDNDDDVVVTPDEEEECVTVTGHERDQTVASDHSDSSIDNDDDVPYLIVSTEISGLFAYIKAYSAPLTNLKCILKPLIPDYIPSVGVIDPFLKVERPDNRPEKTGLAVLYEPALNELNYCGHYATSRHVTSEKEELAICDILHETTVKQQLRANAPDLIVKYSMNDKTVLNVSKEISDLFFHINEYVPPTPNLECKLKPFIIDYIPTVGQIDPFLKMKKPNDEAFDRLGFTVLDEPVLNTWNPSGLAFNACLWIAKCDDINLE
jgi:hypothetical protein